MREVLELAGMRAKQVAKREMTEAALSDLDDLSERLVRSKFRSRFKLGRQDRGYLTSKGMEAIVRYAHDFVDRRHGPAIPTNDGKQTPMRGHPAFVAQHATATCCRSCLSKWHGIAAGRGLRESERRYVVNVIEHWLNRAAEASAPPAAMSEQPDLFDRAVGG